VPVPVWEWQITGCLPVNQCPSTSVVFCAIVMAGRWGEEMVAVCQEETSASSGQVMSATNVSLHLNSFKVADNHPTLAAPTGHTARSGCRVNIPVHPSTVICPCGKKSGRTYGECCRKRHGARFFKPHWCCCSRMTLNPLKPACMWSKGVYQLTPALVHDIGTLQAHHKVRSDWRLF
jgi:hypothetical protein